MADRPKRTWRILPYGFAIIGGVVLGGGTALALSGLIPGFGALSSGSVRLDHWASDFAIGSDAADPYTKARVARHGLLALARSEAIYFTRSVDNEGQQLREECRYRLSGGPMPAHWWSVTVYDAQSRLPMNTDNALSIDATRAGTGEWSVQIARNAPAEGLWLSSQAAGEFDLTLRLYVPDKRLFTDPAATLTPPAIERLDCAGDAA